MQSEAEHLAASPRRPCGLQGDPQIAANGRMFIQKLNSLQCELLAQSQVKRIAQRKGRANEEEDAEVDALTKGIPCYLLLPKLYKLMSKHRKAICC